MSEVAMTVGAGVAIAAPWWAKSRGNVGIGTTAPAQKLHVEDQCVTGDTVLQIIRNSIEINKLNTMTSADNAGSNQAQNFYITPQNVNIRDLE